MTPDKTTYRKIANFFRPVGRKGFMAVFLALFLLGYNLTVSQIQYCSAVSAQPNGTQTPAQPPSVPPAPAVVIEAPCSTVCVPCEQITAAATATTTLILNLYALLNMAANQLENWVYINVEAVLQSEYNQLDWIEGKLIAWWNTMWYYNLLPSYQQMTRQLNIELALQLLQLEANADASAVEETGRTYARHDIEDQERHPVEQMCVAATQGGGFTRATAFSRAMLQAWETKSLAPGLNQKTDPNGNIYPGASSAGGLKQKRYDDWQNIFCDSRGNSLSVVHCGNSVDNSLINADVLPVKFLFNNLTINVDDKTPAKNGSTEGKNLELGIEYLINNLVGIPAFDAIPRSAFDSSTGKEGYLLRRSYLARYAAIRSVPGMVAAWRMPGSQMGKWVTDLREGSGAPLSLVQGTSVGGGSSDAIALAGTLSKNPSYKEIMHAVSVDRFNSGMYATKMLTDPGKVEIEKLNVSVFYLMQLRDYYELLERTALTLAVQVSVLADAQAAAPPTAAAPLSPPVAPGG